MPREPKNGFPVVPSNTNGPLKALSAIQKRYGPYVDYAETETVRQKGDLTRVGPAGEPTVLISIATFCLFFIQRESRAIEEDL
jgi:hypothetical protein